MRSLGALPNQAGVVFPKQDPTEVVCSCLELRPLTHIDLAKYLLKLHELPTSKQSEDYIYAIPPDSADGVQEIVEIQNNRVANEAYKPDG